MKFPLKVFRKFTGAVAKAHRCLCVHDQNLQIVGRQNDVFARCYSTKIMLRLLGLNSEEFNLSLSYWVLVEGQEMAESMIHSGYMVPACLK